MELKEGYLLVTLNRPHVKNAINFEVMDLLEVAIERVKRDENCKALILTGAGNVFCSGGDLNVFHALDNQQDAHNMLSRMGAILYELATISKLSFAFLNGPAVGGGLELAAACDFRYAKTDTVMGFIQVQQGITTGWGGGSLLLEKVSESIGMKWLMSGEKFTAEDAYSHGFINGILPEIDEKTILSVIKPIIHHDIHAITAYKNIAVCKRKVSNLQMRMQEEIKRCSELWTMPVHMEAMKRFLK